MILFSFAVSLSRKNQGQYETDKNYSKDTTAISLLFATLAPYSGTCPIACLTLPLLILLESAILSFWMASGYTNAFIVLTVLQNILGQL